MSDPQKPGDDADPPLAGSASDRGWIAEGTRETLPAPPRGTGFTPGTMLAGRYRIVSLLGEGGMGQVYRADDVRLGQPVALKFLALDSEARRERLFAEVRVGRQVSHPNVCRMYDVGEADGQHFLAMEYVDGEDLGSLLARIGRLPADKAIALARDLCAGLAAVHDAGVVHRDLKPANIMIDGRGRARITDFGLAVAREGQRREGIAGTPSYMSPEQLEEREVDARSDLYSLGLILYEMFTGERFYGSTTFGGLLKEHLQPKSGKLSGAPGSVPPSVLPLLARCLEEDAAQRPPSAHTLLASLPGDDALTAAVIAGETPSPELVAAAAAAGEMRIGWAWALLGGALAGLALVAGLADRVTVLGLAPPPRPLEALVDDARQMLARFGYDDGAADTAWSFDWDLHQIEYIAREDRSRTRWRRLRDERPRPGRLFYRTSPRALVPANRHAIVLADDPPLDVPGMTEILLDDAGHLLRFRAVPGEAAGGPGAAEPDWSPLLEAAALQDAGLRPAEPRHPAPMDTDLKRAWEGAFPGQPDVRVRVEAGAYHGRIVWFDVMLPWSVGTAAARERGARSEVPVADAAILLLSVAVPLGGLLLARRNLRLGRGDPVGAGRVALFVFAAYAAARLLQADHVTGFGDELWILIKVLAYPAFWAGLVWMLYVALEPYARRRMPHILISWKRLLNGRFGDPMVGRDVLIGCAGGIAVVLTYQLTVLAPSWLGDPPLVPNTYIRGATLTGFRHIGFRLLVNAYSCVQFSLAFLFLLVLLRLVARRQWLAVAIWVLVLAAPLRGEHLPIEWTAGALRAGVLWLLLTRGGLLGLVSGLYVSFNLVEALLTLDLSAWYAPGGLLPLLVVATLAGYGFRTALAGKSAFGLALED